MRITGSGVAVVATAHHLPERVVTNETLVAETGLKVTPEWILERTGIAERRFAAPGEATSDYVAAVVRELLDRSGLAVDDLSRLIVATTSPDYPTPSTACVAQGKLGATRRFPCLDVAASCTGFMYALEAGIHAVLAGEDLVAVVAAELRSRYLNFRDRSTAVLFGDGAAGVLLGRGPAGQGVLAVTTFAEGAGAMSVYVPAGGSAEPASAETVAAGRHGLLMADGAKVFVAAVEGMEEAAGTVCREMGLELADLALLIPHQANGTMLAEVVRRTGLPDAKVWNGIRTLGNTSSSAVPMALDRALASGRLMAGDLVCLVAVGGGHTAGAALLRVDEALLASANR